VEKVVLNAEEIGALVFSPDTTDMAGGTDAGPA